MHDTIRRSNLGLILFLGDLEYHFIYIPYHIDVSYLHSKRVWYIHLNNFIRIQFISFKIFQKIDFCGTS